MKKIKKLFALTIVASLCLTGLSFGEEKENTPKDEKLLTLEIATKIALEKNLDLKAYDAQKDKVQANIDSYFSSITRNANLYMPGAESALAQVNLAGGQAFLARDKVQRGIILKTEAIKNSVETTFATISMKKRELTALEEKYQRELALHKIDAKKYELGTLSKTALEEKRLALSELNSSLESKKTDLTIAYGELNKLLKLQDFEKYTVDNYQIEYEILDWSEEKVNKYIKQLPDYDMNVLNKKGEADFNRNEFMGILAINNGKEPYMSLKSDIYIADFSASQLAQECINSAKDKYNNLKQLEEGINSLEQNLKSLKTQQTNLATRYKLGQISKSEMQQLESSIKDMENNIKTQKENYMNLKRVFTNRHLAGLAMG